MESQYKVSICVPIYGVEKFIERCAVSLFEQSYENIEYIFVNDCTPDSSIRILEETISRYPHRKEQIKIINHPHNKRLGEARNTAVAAATGRFLLHVDSDDFIDTNIVEVCVARQIETDADIVNFDAITYEKGDITTKITKPDYKEASDYLKGILTREIPIYVWGEMVRTSLYTSNNIRIEDGINCSEDYSVTPRLYYYAKSIAKAYGTYYHYDHRNVKSLTNNFSTRNAKDDLTVIDFLDRFFKDKGNLYNEFLSGAFVLTRDVLLQSAYHNNSEIFNIAKDRVRSFDKSLRKKLSFHEKVMLYLNTKLASLYMKATIRISNPRIFAKFAI